MNTTLRSGRGLLVAATLVLASATAVTASPAEGDAGDRSRKPDRCVSKAEYGQVDLGMKRVRVHRIFGTTGKRESITRDGPRTVEVRTYRGCNDPDSLVTAWFARNRSESARLTQKTAIWIQNDA